TFFRGSTTLYQRMKLYIEDMWNKMFPWSYEFGRAVLAVDYMVFTLRLIHIFAIHKQLGPKIIIVEKMMKDIFFFLFFLAVWLLAYGVANQALLYSYDPRPGWIFRRVFYRPYLHIFGQIPIHEMDADKLEEGRECTNNATLVEAGAEPCMSTDHNWLVVILLVIFLLEHSDNYWKFQRYNLIVEYHSRPCLAPPFILISHLQIFIKRHIRKIPSMKIKHFVLEIHGREASRLNTREAIQKENIMFAQNKRERERDSERLKRTSVKVDSVLKQMAEIRDHDRRLRMLETKLEYCSSALSWMTEALSQSNLIKTTRPPPSLRVQEHSDNYWKFQRYNLIVEYHSRPCLAPPFILISHLHLFIKRHIRKIPSMKIKHFGERGREMEGGILEIHGREASRLNTWEAIQKENIMFCPEQTRKRDSERLKRTSVKMDSVLKQTAEIWVHDHRLRMLLASHTHTLHTQAANACFICPSPSVIVTPLNPPPPPPPLSLSLSLLSFSLLLSPLHSLSHSQLEYCSSALSWMTEALYLEYCSSALSWMTEALSQSNLIKTTRPPPTLRDLTPSLSIS
ncbi:unnamed protein product, partial [Coregonus sp. 'balchen']